MNVIAFIIFIFGLQIVCMYVGKQSTKSLQNQEDYFLAGKNLKFFPLTMTFIATQIGGGVILGSAEEAYTRGLVAILYPLGCVLGLILLGLGLGAKLAKFKVSTIAQIFEVAYGSVLLKKVASMLSIVSLFIILVTQILASSKFMASVGVENKLLFFAFWGIVIFYTSLGGLKAVVATDIVQAFFFIGAFLICTIYICFTTDPGLLQTVSEGVQNPDASLGNPRLYGILIMPILFMIIVQDMGQRCLSAASPKIVSRATLCAALVTIIVTAFPVSLGILANKMGLEIPNNASVLMTVIAKISGPYLTALLGAAILAAIISTADSVLNAISSNIAQDFIFIKKCQVSFSRKLTAVISILAILSSFYFDRIIDLLILSYELSVCCLFVPIFASFFKPKGNKLSAFLAVACGAFGLVIFRFFWIDFPRELLSVMFSSIGFMVGEGIIYMRKSALQNEEGLLVE